MADTIRTVNELLTIFADGQPDGSISEQDMRDFIVSMEALIDANTALVSSSEWVYQETFTLTAAADLVLNPADYSVGANQQIKLVHDGLSVTVDDTAIIMQLSYDDGLSYANTNYQFNSIGGGVTSVISAGSLSTTAIPVTHFSTGEKMSNQANHVFDGETIMSGIDASRTFRASTRCHYNWALTASGAQSNNLSGGDHQMIDAVDRIKIYPESGTMSGKIHLYTRSNSA